MQTKDLENIAIQVLEDSKALDTTTIDVRPLTTITDLMIICTGRSTRHVKSIADNLVVQAEKNHVTYLHVEGNHDSEWVLVDMGDIVVHIMLPAIRTFYDLESLWEPLSEFKTKASR